MKSGTIKGIIYSIFISLLVLLAGCAAERNNPEDVYGDEYYTYMAPDFSADVTEGDAPLTVQFTDATTGKDLPDSWEWDFDSDGTVDSTDQNPVYVFQTEGRYDVTLTVRNEYGDNSERKNNFIFSKGFHGIKKIDESSLNERLTGNEPDIAVLNGSVYISYYEEWDDAFAGLSVNQLKLAFSSDKGLTWPFEKNQKVLNYYTDYVNDACHYSSVATCFKNNTINIFVVNESNDFLGNLVEFIKSDDNGLSWSHCAYASCINPIHPKIYEEDGFESWRPEIKIVGDQAQLYCAYFREDSSLNLAVGFSKSIDEGETWIANEFINGPPAPKYSHVPFDIVEDTIDGNNIYAFFTTYDLPSFFDLSLKKSYDDGLLWESVYYIDYADTISEVVISALPGVSNNIDNIYIVYFADDHLKMARNCDGSSDFDLFDIETNITGSESTSIKVIKDDTNDDDIYLSYIADNALKFARSLDGGETWIIRTVDDSGGIHTSIDVEGNDVYIVYYRDNTLWFAKSIDGGDTWD
ncbi:MAG: hypothetical protein CVV44_06720 [Spirochaetae bacterium HGW-Spirochaetae-1]|jgi:PKD repeat protein|nr:MAG: hypothetical protein CVV44_06720 [Spirochaetae bacterium HGW-Spirochaetae-1]